MTAFNKYSVSKSKKTNTGCDHFEALESRQLMSVSVTQITLHAKVMPVNLSTLFVEPNVDSKVTGWKNVSKDPLFAPGGPSINDVVQGNVNDGWFLAALGSTAKQDITLVQRDIQQLSDGTYDVSFETSSAKTTVEHVDGLLPTNSSGGLEYAKLGKDNCTWVAIMEKALTYYRNKNIPASYSTLSGGTVYEGSIDITSAAGEVLPSITSSEEIYTDVKSYLQFDNAVEIATNSSSGPLVHDQGYSVVSTRVSGGIDEIEVRNPSGSNPNFVANRNGYGATNNGYMWVSTASIWPELNELMDA